jgi:hypothetical protein
MSDVTHFLEAAAAGDGHAATDLLPLVYQFQDRIGEMSPACALMRTCPEHAVGVARPYRHTDVKFF